MTTSKKMQIYLAGPDGNAYVLMAYAKSICKKVGKSPEGIHKEMMIGDYENLLNVFRREFGDLVDLV